MLIACAFNYDAHSAEFDKLGRVPVLKARMNPDLHMGGDLKSDRRRQPLRDLRRARHPHRDARDGRLRVKVFGVDVFKPQTGEVVSEGTDGIALWMLDDDYNEESFFVRHAYFLGANDPYKALKTTLKAEIDEEAWSSLYSDTSRPFDKPKSGRIAVKVINHLGDEVMGRCFQCLSVFGLLRALAWRSLCLISPRRTPRMHEEHESGGVGPDRGEGDLSPRGRGGVLGSLVSFVL